jgi:methyltransferase (TIGR00027 family)
VIADVVRLAAAYRAREDARADAVARDPFARQLVGPIDGLLAEALASPERLDWLFIARSYAIDRLLAREVAGGIDAVLSLGAGLDSRPYRLALPRGLVWIEADAADVLDYKSERLAAASASCRVERIPIDLSNPDGRRGVLAGVARRGARVLVVSEGLLIHLMSDEVRGLARELSAIPSFHRWLFDIVSPALLPSLNDHSGALVRAAGAPYLFAPREGPAFFARDGWRVLGVRSLLKTAQKLERLPGTLRLLGMMSDGQHHPDRPWAGACLLGNESARVID